MHPVSIVVRRDLEWMDTDAAGIWHFSTALRYVEQAENELHRRLGIADRTVGCSPRVRIEMDYVAPVRFGEEVATRLTVAHVGRTSLTYDAQLEGPHGTVARARMTTVFIANLDAGAQPIPDDLRSVLTGARASADEDRGAPGNVSAHPRP